MIWASQKEYFFYWNWYNMVYYYWNNVVGSKQSSLSDFSVFVHHFFLTLLFLSTQLAWSQYWAIMIPIIGSVLVAGRLPICCTKMIPYGCRYEAMASQYWPNISRQDIANANIASGNPVLSQCGLTRERQRQFLWWETNFGPTYSCCLGYDQKNQCNNALLGVW